MCDLLNSVLLVYDVFDFVRLLVLHQSGHTGADLMLDDVRVFLDELERQTNRMGILRIHNIRRSCPTDPGKTEWTAERACAVHG